MDDVVDEIEVSPKSTPQTGRSLSSSLPSSLIALTGLGHLAGRESVVEDKRLEDEEVPEAVGAVDEEADAAL